MSEQKTDLENTMKTESVNKNIKAAINMLYISNNLKKNNEWGGKMKDILRRNK